MRILYRLEVARSNGKGKVIRGKGKGKVIRGKWVRGRNRVMVGRG